MIKKQCYVLLIFVAVLYLDAVAAQQKFRIANIQPITGKFNSIVVPMVNAMHLWEKNTNARGGFLINGQNYTVEVVDIDVGSKIDAEFNNKTINETQNVVGGVYGEIHVVFAPYSSDLTPISALVSEAAGMPSIAGGAASENIFICDSKMLVPCTAATGRRFKYLVGTVAGSTTYFPSAISLMRVAGAKTAVVFSENAAFTKGMADGALAACSDNSISVLNTFQLPRVSSYTADNTAAIKSMAEKIRDLDPDIVIGGTYDLACQQFVNISKEINWAPNAIIMSVCLGSIKQYQAYLGEDGRYVTGPVQWDRRLNDRTNSEDGLSRAQHYPKTVSQGSAELFYLDYVEEFDEEPTYQGAQMYAGAMILQVAAESIDAPTNRDALMEKLNQANLVTFYGQVQFSPFGQIATSLGAIVQVDVDNVDKIVAPIASSATAVVYPMPDWTERVQVIAWYSTPAELGIVIVAGICGLGTIALMILFFVWRKRPQIIASSLLFCELILLGAVIMFAGIFFWTMEMDDAACNLRYWLMGVGFAMIYGNLLAKTWRIWRIFTYKKLKVLKLPNIVVFRFVAIMVAAEIIVLTIWSAAFTPRAVNNIPDPARPIHNYRTCSDENELPFAIVLIIYNGLLIIAGTVIGVRARKVRSEYNEARFILLTNYNLCFAGVILLILYLIRISDRNLDFLLRSVAFLWGIIATVAILFIPKVYYVLTGKKDFSKRENVMTFGNTTSSGSSASNGGGDELDMMKKQLATIEAQRDILEGKIKDKEKSLGIKTQATAQQTEAPAAAIKAEAAKDLEEGESSSQESSESESDSHDSSEMTSDS